jgi:hypothetical protein
MTGSMSSEPFMADLLGACATTGFSCSSTGASLRHVSTSTTTGHQTALGT